MPDVPDEVLAALQQKAARRGQSLSEYLSSELRRLVERPSIHDVLDKIECHGGGRVGLEQAVEDLRATRGND